MKKWFFFVGFFAAIGSFGAFATAKEQDKHPQALVSTVTQAALDTLKNNKARLQKEPEFLESIINDYILPYMDFTAMAKLVLGQAWKDAANEQREAFEEQFKALLVRTYAKSLREYSDQSIEFLPFEESNQPDRLALVKSKIKRSSGGDIPIDYKLRYKRSDNWKIYDISIEGISLVTNYRNSFAREITQQGIPHLIQSLEEQNRKPVNASSTLKK